MKPRRKYARLKNTRQVKQLFKSLRADPGNGPCQQKVLAEYNNNNNIFKIALLGCLCPTCCCVHCPDGTYRSHLLFKLASHWPNFACGLAEHRAFAGEQKSSSLTLQTQQFAKCRATSSAQSKQSMVDMAPTTSDIRTV